ncbi:MAG TPA: formimidoylglutamate deiminase [Pseudonocardiaceae bacterium]
MADYWCEHAWLPDGIATGVRVEITEDRITEIVRDQPRSGTVLDGLTLPGLANAHSHAFHRALRGRTHPCRTPREPGTFWSWREAMYAVADRLDPDSYYRLARAVYAEMVLAGYTSVGEFHYLHHAPGGARYADPNAMGAALVAAARDAGIRLCLLDTCYLAGGFDGEPAGVQQRFSDGDAESWIARVASFRPANGGRDWDGRRDGVVVGAAVHSVRAVPLKALPTVAAWSRGRPLHAHVSEQRAENADCLLALGDTPAAVLAEAGVLGPRAVAVHATHLTDADRIILATSGARACFCPTTERDLGDGIGAARELSDAGVPLCLGSDSHAMIDPFEEARALEMNERLVTEQRGRFTVAQLLAASTDHGALGFPEAGRIAPGARADLVTVTLDSPRTAGIEPDGVFFAATAADVREVMIAGRSIVHDGVHRLIERPSALLAREIERLWR